MRNELWKIDVELYSKMDHEIDTQIASLPEAEVIEHLMAFRKFTFDECMKMKRDLKGDCRFKCWN